MKRPSLKDILINIGVCVLIALGICAVARAASTPRTEVSQVVFIGDSPSYGHHFGYLGEENAGCISVHAHQDNKYTDMCHDLAWRDYCVEVYDTHTGKTIKEKGKTIKENCSGWLRKGDLYTPKEFFSGVKHK